MARVTFQYFEEENNDVKVGVSDIRLEVFEGSTWAVSANSGSTIRIATRETLENGDSFYIELADGTFEVLVVSDATFSTGHTLRGEGDVDVASPPTSGWSDNAIIVRKKDISVDAVNDDWAPTYDSEDFDTGLFQPIDLDANHGKTVSLKAGSYGIRWSNNDTGATQALENRVVYRWDDVFYPHRYAQEGTGTAASPWKGFEGAFADQRHIKFVAGHYESKEIDLAIAANAESQPIDKSGQLLVEGPGANLAFIHGSVDPATNAVLGIRSSGGNNLSHLTLRGFTVTTDVANTKSLVHIQDVEDKVAFDDVTLDNNGQSVVTGLQMDDVSEVRIMGLRIFGTAANQFTTGIKHDSSDRGAGSYGDVVIEECVTPIAITGATMRGFKIDTPHLRNANPPAGSTAISIGDSVKGNTIINPDIDSFDVGIDLNASSGNLLLGGYFDTCKNVGDTDGAAIVIDGGDGNIIVGPSFDNCYDGLEVTAAGNANVMIVGAEVSSPFTNELVVDAGATTDNRVRIIRGGQDFHEIRQLSNVGTPSVYSQKVFITGGTTTITDLLLPEEGQIIHIISNHTVTIQDGIGIELGGNRDFDMIAGDTLTLLYASDGNWYEIARSLRTGTAITSLTDSTGGTANNTIAAFTGTNYSTDSSAIRDNFADLAAKVNECIVALRNAGLS